MLGDVRQQYRQHAATTMPPPTAVIAAQYWPPPMLQLATGDRIRTNQHQCNRNALALLW
jgi:hypothetical protein